MKFGIMPLFLREFLTQAQWVKSFVRMVEAAGCDSVWQVEHPIVAEDYEPLYSYSADGKAPFSPAVIMPDPLEWLAFAAAASDTIKLGTAVVVLPLHSPIVIAKRVATLDALSGGRVLLGVGSGWQKEEYAAVHVPYEQRGKRLDEIIEAMRVLWRDSPASYAGEHYQFHRVHCDTKPARPEGVPILIGGSTEVAAKRAGRLGNGFYPYVISPEDLAKRLQTLRRTAREHGRNPDDIEITAWPSSWRQGGAMDLGLVREYAALGVQRLIFSAHEAGSLEMAGIERFIQRYRDEIIAKL